VSELTVIANEFKFDLNSDTVKSGTVTITIKNEGRISHEFVLLKEEDAEKRSPVIVELERSELPSGGVKTIEVNLKSGRYEIACHVRGHYEEGMKTTITVVDQF